MFFCEPEFHVLPVAEKRREGPVMTACRVALRRSSGAPAALLLILAGSTGAAGQSPPESAVAATEPARPELSRLRQHVMTLASPEFGGRQGEGARKTEAYVTNAFRALGLDPLFGDSFTQDIPGEEPGVVLGRNVGARLPGSVPALADEWILVSAHYDHLGVRNGVLYPGADDNASGVAMLLEAARCLVDTPPRPRRGVMFVAFDLEEPGLWGSRHFVEEPPVPLDQIKLFLTADLIGGALAGVCREQVFVIGSEHAPDVRPWIEAAGVGLPLRPALVGSDLLLINRSDYGPFRSKQVPYLFFSTGENPRYHTPQDTAESLDYPKLEAISRLIEGVVRRASIENRVPPWQKAPDNPLAEAIALRDVIKTLLEHRESLQIQGLSLNLMTSTLAQIEEVVHRGQMTPGERGRIVRAAQLILMTVL